MSPCKRCFLVGSQVTIVGLICLVYFMWQVHNTAPHRLDGWTWLRIVHIDSTALLNPEKQITGVSCVLPSV